MSNNILADVVIDTVVIAGTLAIWFIFNPDSTTFWSVYGVILMSEFGHQVREHSGKIK